MKEVESWLDDIFGKAQHGMYAEQYLLNNGWKAIDYPYDRSHWGYQYTVYSHCAYSGVWDKQSAMEKTTNQLIWLY